MKRILFFYSILLGCAWSPAGTSFAGTSTSGSGAHYFTTNHFTLSPQSGLNPEDNSPAGKFESFHITSLDNLSGTVGTQVEIQAQVEVQGNQRVFLPFVGKGSYASKAELETDFNITGVESIDSVVKSFFYARFVSDGRLLVLENAKSHFGVGTVFEKTLKYPYLVLSSPEMAKQPEIVFLALAQLARETNPNFEQTVLSAVLGDRFASFKYTTRLREIAGSSDRASVSLRFQCAIKALGESKPLRQGSTEAFVRMRRTSLAPGALTEPSA